MGIILNEDCTDFIYTRKPEEINEESIRKQMDFYAQFGFDTILFNGNAQKSFYLSDVLDPIWKDVVEKDGSMYYRDREVVPVIAQMVRNAKLLNQNIPDHLGFRIRYGRSLGMKVFLSMRMNDCHCVDTDPDHILISDMWRDHQDWLTMPFTSFFWGRTFDYARKEVYDFHLAIMKEYLTKFDPDGLELDWMRSPCYFQPGTEDQNAHILTEFMRETRKAADECAKRNGHPVELSVRVPCRPDDARRMGMDVPRWVQENLISSVTPCSYWGVTDFDIPLELWRTILGDGVKLAPGLELIFRSSMINAPKAGNTSDVIFGYAASFYHRGADDIYLFNHMENPGGTGMRDRDDYMKVLKNLTSKEKTECQKRRHVVSYADPDTRAKGLALDQIIPLSLSSAYSNIRVNLGGATAKRQAKLVIGWENRMPETVRVNGVICQCSDEVFQEKLPGNTGTIAVYPLPCGTLKDGDNFLSFQGDPEGRIVWCEVDIAEK